MKKVTMYVAEDGRRFARKQDCLKYEADGCVEFEPLPEYGDHLPLTEQAFAWMRNGDGSCYYATKDRLSRQSAGSAPHPIWATHLVYFGK